jgi:hypothetical protein
MGTHSNARDLTRLSIPDHEGHVRSPAGTYLRVVLVEHVVQLRALIPVDAIPTVRGTMGTSRVGTSSPRVHIAQLPSGICHSERYIAGTQACPQHSCRRAILTAPREGPRRPAYLRVVQPAVLRHQMKHGAPLCCRPHQLAPCSPGVGPRH